MRVQKVNLNFNFLNLNKNKSNISFSRSIEEHKSWGAFVNPKTEDVSFKILAYPDSQCVNVSVFKKSNPRKQNIYELNNKGDGVFETTVPISSKEIQAGDKYFYTIKRGDSVVCVKDPYSFEQDKIFGPSTIYDQSNFKWSDESWVNNKNHISRLANKENGLLSLKSANIYELHIGTFTQEGTYKSAAKKLDKIKKMGFNTIEIMPTENTYSFNWGYDGVDKFAPSKVYGEPDDLKSLINHAHNTGLNVIMDMVPNHMGPEGNQLKKTGPYISSDKDTPFGDKFNYMEKDSKYVRDFMTNAALNWLINYHCDGLRLDLTSDMNSDYTMKQIAAEVNYHKPDAFLIAEDGRMSDSRITKPLDDIEIGKFSPLSHEKAIEDISSNKANVSIENLGFDSRWDFDLYHTIRSCLSGEGNLNALEYSCYCSQDRVKYLMSHDEIGNHEGTRLIPKLMSEELKLFDKISLNDDDYKRMHSIMKKTSITSDEAYLRVKGQKTQMVAEKLSNILSNDMSDILKKVYIKKLTDIKSVSYDDIKIAHENAFNKSKMAIAKIYAIPGVKMIFQGDEASSQTPFRFFREFALEYPETWLHDEKGYDTGRAAYKESNMEASPDTDNSGYLKLVSDLNLLNKENAALSSGYFNIEDTVKHPKSNVIGMNAVDFDSDNQIYTITNLNSASYENYNIKFPKGEWREVINTDSKKYGGSGKYDNKNIIVSCDIPIPIHVSGFSTLIFKKIK